MISHTFFATDLDEARKTAREVFESVVSPKDREGWGIDLTLEGVGRGVTPVPSMWEVNVTFYPPEEA